MNAPVMLVQLTVADLEALIERAIAKALAAHVPAPLPATRLLARSGLALTLGVSLASVDRLIHDGCPSVFVGQTRRFEESVVLAWLDARPKPAPREPTAAPVVSMAGVRRLSRGSR